MHTCITQYEKSETVEKNSESRSSLKKKGSRVLLTLTTVCGILYLVLVISSFFEGAHDAGMIIVYVVFPIFLIGYYYSRRNELFAGIVFILWWGIMWYLGLFVAEQDRGAGIVMGVPLFILGVLFIVSWYRKKARATSTA
jgi:hypothetical protein